MKIFLLVLIRAYWLIIPEAKRRKCLFKISCSNYVFQKAKKEGLISGFRALKFRAENCNSNYNILNVNGEKILVTKMNTVFKEGEFDESILN